MVAQNVFTRDFLDTLQLLVRQHHLLYPRIPPRDIFFESLVEKAFKNTSAPFLVIESTQRNAPRHDLIVGEARLSVKSETGAGTKRDFIHITKLCTTERDPWDAPTLIAHVLAHLSRYDLILTLRAVWNDPVIAYQLVEIPIEILKKNEGAALAKVGKPRTRQSLAAEIANESGKTLFRVYFDGTDGKCQIQKLRVSACNTLLNWEHHIRD